MPEILQVDDGCASMLTAAGLSRLPDFFAWDSGTRLDKPSLEDWRQRWRMQLADAGGRRRTVYLKRFDRPPLRRQWERWRAGASSTAAIEWRNARELARAGVRAARPVAFGAETAGPLEVRSFIVLGEAAGESLERWVPAHLPPSAAEADLEARRARLDALARFVARFHDAGFVHRDLYLCHIFFDPAAIATDGKLDPERAFCLIDLQRVFRPRRRARRWAVKDLAALDFSTPADRVGSWERLRFLCRYVKYCDRFGSARLLAGKIAAKSRRMARRVRGSAAPG